MTSLNRRSFFKSAAALGGLSFCPDLLDSVKAAFRIEPPAGSTFLDAEHIVFLMQENRSFDHCFGSLQGVRGFNDPRFISLPNGRPVWVQQDVKGRSFVPFRLDIRESSSTHTNCLPHSWTDQQQARNHGKYDQWLVAKPSGNAQLSELPLTLGYYTRSDIPFYYALADAFTICDQHFCSSLTGTTPNRLHFWTGTIRAEQTPASKANLSNGDCDFKHPQSWTTFPERLTENGISWKVYQNEISLETGLLPEQERLLASFGDNPLEYFSQYNVRFSESYRENLLKLARDLPEKIAKQTESLERSRKTNSEAELQRLTQAIAKLQAKLELAQQDLENWHPDRFKTLSPKDQEIHHRAFTTNRDHPDYRRLSSVEFISEGKTKSLQIPKGDIFHQFRQDVDSGKLPTVSWLVAPQQFSDHPSAPWNGAWYVSEALKILTKNPELWKKTIFILNYDENDGYFDHIPPFVPPVPGHPETGACSKSIDSSQEIVPGKPDSAVGDPIGLGYRVPMVVASPWTRGGWVNSEVFDLTSPIRFLEYFLKHKFQKDIRETNISSWRRQITGDMTSLFHPANETGVALSYLQQDKLMVQIAEAKDKPLPSPGQPLSKQEIETLSKNPSHSSRFPRQEPGTRPSCPLPYELQADCFRSPDTQKLRIRFAAGNHLFKERAAGAPFSVYAPGKFALQTTATGSPKEWENVHIWNYAVAAGESLQAEWSLADFAENRGHLRVYGPNGFFREFVTTEKHPAILVSAAQKELGNILILSLENAENNSPLSLKIHHHAYQYPERVLTLSPKGTPGATKLLPLDLAPSSGWYDFSVTVPDFPGIEFRYAGRIESGTPSISDPQMGTPL